MFSCSKNKDIEDFLFNKAVDFEDRGLSRTFIISNSDGAFLGYFALSLKAIVLNSDISKSLIKKIGGGFEHKSYAVYLIGQLGRNDSCNKENLPSSEILDIAIRQILKAKASVAGRCVVVECEEHLIKIYEDYGFKMLQKNPVHHKLNQLIKFI